MSGSRKARSNPQDLESCVVGLTKNTSSNLVCHIRGDTQAAKGRDLKSCAVEQ